MRSFYEIENVINIKTPVLLHNFDSPLESGRASQLVMRHLYNTLKHVRIAKFNIDELLDFKTYRPIATYNDWTLVNVEVPSINLDLFYDDKGVAFLVLTGPEPSRGWVRFSQDLLKIIKPFDVKVAFSLSGMNSSVPHTRKAGVDITVTNSKYNTSTKTTSNFASDNFRVLCNIDVYLQSQFSKHNIDCFGLVTPVPFYLSESDYPQSAYLLLQKFVDMTSLVLPLGDLAVACEIADGLLAKSPEIAENTSMIKSLEDQFDKGVSSSASSSNVGLANADNKLSEVLPSGDELAQSVEAFLKTQSGIDSVMKQKSKTSAKSSIKHSKKCSAKSYAKKTLKLWKKFFGKK